MSKQEIIMKIGIEQCESLLREMNRLKEEHPKADVYFDGEEIRITYSLPRDFERLKGIIRNPPR